MWLGKFVLSRGLTSPEKQLESLYVSSLTRKKKSTYNSLHITSITSTKIQRHIHRVSKTNTNYTAIYLAIYKLTFADAYEEDEDDNQDQRYHVNEKVE
ncbi:hypothetical protein YC2023_041801 [Brassica napus]